MTNFNPIDFIKDKCATGYPMIDSMLILHVLPLMLSYFQVILDNSTRLIYMFFTIISGYIIGFIKYRLVGDIICRIRINESNELYNFISEKVFSDEVKSDVSQISRLMSINDSFDEKSKDVTSSTILERTFRVNINYSGCSLFNSKFYADERENKIFMHQGYYIRFIYSTKDNIKEVFIDFISFKKHPKYNHKEFVDILENFLESRFRISENLEYVYKIVIGNPDLNITMANFTTSGWVDTSSGLLKYGDNLIDIINKNRKTGFVSNNLIANIKCTNLDDEQYDYVKQLEIFDNSSTFITDRDDSSFASYYQKYVSKNFIQCNTYGYFVKDNLTYLIYKNNNVWTLCIISKGRFLCDKDLKDEINWIIKQEISSRGKVSEETEKKNTTIFRRSDGNWKAYILDVRSFDTIYLPKKLMKSIRDEMDKFIAMEKLYREYQIPYKKGMLFYGPPGTGKTSLVKSLAYEYQLNIYTININDEEINDDTITDILNSIGGGGNKILLFEDIDSAFADKEKIKHEEKSEKTPNLVYPPYFPSNKKDGEKASDFDKYSDLITNTYMMAKESSRRKYLTYSGLLNALDGVMSNQHGVITIMTTNYIEKLGSAILRQGRIDKTFELKECNREQIIIMTNTFITKRLELTKSMNENEKYPREEIDKKINEFADILTDKKGDSRYELKPCQLQYYLLKYIEDIDDIFNNHHELTEG